eukprot:6179168-Pleurochrysis_carterae.AAC.2
METACRTELCSRQTPCHFAHWRVLVVVLYGSASGCYTQALCLCLNTNKQRNLPISLTVVVKHRGSCDALDSLQYGLHHVADRQGSAGDVEADDVSAAAADLLRESTEAGSEAIERSKAGTSGKGEGRANGG